MTDSRPRSQPVHESRAHSALLAIVVALGHVGAVAARQTLTQRNPA